MLRNKPASAQKPLIAGLTADLARSESVTLWLSLHALEPDLTLPQLHESVISQIEDPSKLAALPSDEEIAQSSQQMVEVQAVAGLDSAESKEQESAILADIIEISPEFNNFDDMSGWTVEGLLQTYRVKPVQLLCAPSKEPLASGLTHLTATEITELESFLMTPLASLSTLDATADPVIVRAQCCLDVLEALWHTQALKERHFDAWTSALRAKHFHEVHPTALDT
jgi:hypothetical protein